MHMDAYASDHAHGAATDLEDYPGPDNGALRRKILSIISAGALADPVSCWLAVCYCMRLDQVMQFISNILYPSVVSLAATCSSTSSRFLF